MDSIIRNQDTVEQTQQIEDGLINLWTGAACPQEHATEEGTKIEIDYGMKVLGFAVICSTRIFTVCRPASHEQAADLQRAAFATFQSDHIAVVNAFNRFLRILEEYQKDGGPNFDPEIWRKRHFLDITALATGLVHF